jgi:hypothetical protein
MGLHHPSLIAAANTPTATVFFQEICAAVLRAQSAFTTHCRTIITFEVIGAGGGQWTVDLGRGQVTPGASAKANANISTDAESFAQLLNGELEIYNALETDRLRIAGLLDAVTKFTALLCAA